MDRRELIRQQQCRAAAFPDADVDGWRARLVAHAAAAAVASTAGSRFVALLVLLAAVPTLRRYVRREWALGALLAAERRRAREVARVPTVDLRAWYPPQR